MQSEVGRLFVGEEDVVLAQQVGADPLGTVGGGGVALLHLTEEKVVVAVHQLAGEEPVGKELQVADEAGEMDALGVEVGVHPVGDDVGQLADQAGGLHGVAPRPHVHPGVDDVEGDVAGFLFGQKDVQQLAGPLQPPQADVVLALVKVLELPQHPVGDGDAQLLALDREVEVVGQHQVDVGGQPDAERRLGIGDDVLGQLEVDRRDGGKQLDHGLRVGVGQGDEHPVGGLPVDGLTGAAAVADALAQQDGLLAVVVLHKDDAAVQHLTDPHEGSPPSRPGRHVRSGLRRWWR